MQNKEKNCNTNSLKIYCIIESFHKIFYFFMDKTIFEKNGRIKTYKLIFCNLGLHIINENSVKSNLVHFPKTNYYNVMISSCKDFGKGILYVPNTPSTGKCLELLGNMVFTFPWTCLCYLGGWHFLWKGGPKYTGVRNFWKKSGGHKIFYDHNVRSHKMMTDSVFILFKKTDFNTILACLGGKVYQWWGGHKFFVA